MGEYDKLISAAKQARENAHAPYSNFRVGAALREREFDIMVIPFTWMHTNMETLAAGTRVNIECDVIGKYVVRAAAIAAFTPKVS